MPIIVPIKHVVPGSLSGEDILNFRGDLLLGKNVVISRRILESLRKNGISSLSIASSQEEGRLACNEIVPRELSLKAKKQIRELHALSESRKGISPALISNLLVTAQHTVEHVMGTDQAILSQVKNIASHDVYTYEHSWMVFLFTFGLLREALQREAVKPMDPPCRNSVAMGALLHDIGKTLIPLEILNKEGKLSSEEMEEMQKHPQLGADLLRDHESINPFSRSIILHHHQRWDGKGYGPSSGYLLKEEDIPGHIHIVSLADNFDALTSDRPYRKGFLPHEALRIIHQASGTYFSPEIIPFARNLAVDFPIGSVLLLENGTVANVNGFETRGNDITYRCYIVGTLVQKSANLLGETFMISKEDILCGANSVQGLRERMASQKSLVSFFPGAPLAITALQPWEKLMEEEFGTFL